MKITALKPNEQNPYPVKSDAAFLHLVELIERYPKFLKLRPIIYDPKTKMILGGNKRYAALKHLGYKEIPNDWVMSAAGLTEEEKNKFIIADNFDVGVWSIDYLNDEDIEEFKLDVIKFDWQNMDDIDGDLETPNIDSDHVIKIVIGKDHSREDAVDEITELLKQTKFNVIEIK